MGNWKISRIPPPSALGVMNIEVCTSWRQALSHHHLKCINADIALFEVNLQKRQLNWIYWLPPNSKCLTFHIALNLLTNLGGLVLPLVQVRIVILGAYSPLARLQLSTWEGQHAAPRLTLKPMFFPIKNFIDCMFLKFSFFFFFFFFFLWQNLLHIEVFMLEVQSKLWVLN